MDVGLEPDGGNLYRPHLMMVNSGQFWHCAHGLTGFVGDMEWGGCHDCANADPEAFAKWHRSRPADQEGRSDG